MKTNKIDKSSSLEIRILELVRLRIAYLNECPYSIDLHYNELKNFGETDLRLSLVSVWNETPYFSGKERALFSLADYITSSVNRLSLAEVHKALVRHFNEDEINELTQAIKQIDLWTRSMKHFKSETICKKTVMVKNVVI